MPSSTRRSTRCGSTIGRGRVSAWPGAFRAPASGPAAVLVPTIGVASLLGSRPRGRLRELIVRGLRLKVDEAMPLFEEEASE